MKNTQLRILSHISRALVHSRDVSALLREVLDVITHDLGVERGTLTLRHGDVLVIEAASGLSDVEMKRGQYRIGEGITGKVAAAGKSRLIPNISRESGFLDRTKSRRSSLHMAFLCVPIILHSEVIGTLSIDHPPDTDETLQDLLAFLETVANILADAVATFREEINEREQLKAENERLRQELGSHFRPSNIIGNCGAMRQIYGMIAQVAESPATVLIRGESGTGKELVARAIHHASERKGRPFVAVNCAALPENLIESELFGHEKGSFTGAIAQRKGRFELANGGTIFLDEIGDIALPVQIRLLRVLQERNFERVGGHEPIAVNVRVIAATSRDLEAKIADGSFREDLYYRLNVFPVMLPALRERKSDIILLADHFLAKYNQLYHKQVRRISTPAINMMMAYHWPGNVRELENCLERAVLMSANDVVSAYDLPPSLQTAQESGTSILPPGGAADLATMVASFEREIIVDALKNHRGNVAAASRALGSTQRILHYRITKLDIAPTKYR